MRKSIRTAKLNSAIRQLLDRLRPALLDPPLHSRPDAIPICLGDTFFLFEIFKHQRVATLTSDDPVRPSQESDQVFRVLILSSDTGQPTAFVDHAAEYGLMGGSGDVSVAAAGLEH